MMNLPLGHVLGIPVEETVGSFGPALLVALGVAVAKLRARVRRVRSRRRTGVSRGAGATETG